MKILIAGGSCMFRKSLIDRLNREKHEIYAISGKNNHIASKKCIHYDIDLTDDKIRYIIYSIMPDAVIFLGAFDENYDFSNEQKAAMDFNASLSNMLITISSMNIKKFIYLSSSMVYGRSYNAVLYENMEKMPEDVRSLVIAEGESMCMEFKKISNMKLMILRISDVYGINTEKNNDFCSKLFLEAVKASGSGIPFEPKADMKFSPVYFSDVVDAVYKAVVTDTDGTDIYNVAADEVKLSYIYEKIGELTGLAINGEHKDADSNFTPMLNLCVDYSHISEKMGFRPLINIDTGLMRMHQAFNKNPSMVDVKPAKEGHEYKDKKRLLHLITPFIENIMVFLVMAGISIAAESGIAFLHDINFMVLYIVIIAMTFGLFQASLSIVLAGVFTMWQMVRSGLNAYDTLINLGTLGKILELMIIGIICGHAKDFMTTSIYEKNLELKDNENELDTIYKINDTNIKIKKTLDERLINYEDSLAKIYTIVDKLNAIQPDDIFFSAVDVIMEIMNADDVSIYMVTGGDFKMCRLMAKTPDSLRINKKSVALSDWGEMGECLLQNKIYVNRNMDSDMPIMAAPVFSQQSLVSIIMLWSLKFENLSIYNTNRFLVLNQLISSAIERAYIFLENMNDSMYLTGTNILNTEAFENLLDIHKKAARSNTSTYELLLVSNISTMEEPLNALEGASSKIRSLLRSMDYIGQYKDDDDKLLVLLTNTNTDDSKFVYDRLSKAGFTCLPYSD